MGFRSSVKSLRRSRERDVGARGFYRSWETQSSTPHGSSFHRARRFASRMLHRYRQNSGRNKLSSPAPDPEKQGPKEEIREKSKKRKDRKDELVEAIRTKKENAMKRVASLTKHVGRLGPIKKYLTLGNK